MTALSCTLASMLFMLTSAELKFQEKQYVNNTNLEEITMEHFRMHIFLNGYHVLLLANGFYLELNIWGYREFIQFWRTNKWKGHRFLTCVLIYLVVLISVHFLPRDFSSIEKEYYFKVKNNSKFLFFLIVNEIFVE